MASEQKINESLIGLSSGKSLSAQTQRKNLAKWLLICCSLVFVMITVGAITRLTESGLSIVEWKPVIGAIPPLSESAWRTEFEAYKLSPEFMKKNFWMTVDDFKTIYFWEWFHRFLGRLIGLAYALPCLYFWSKKRIPQGYRIKLPALVLLVAVQGAMGWYMVKSGLVDQPAVSHYRLAAHLGLALLLYGLSLWYALDFWRTEKENAPRPNHTLSKFGWGTFALIATTILWGAFTAGLDAGLVYNDTFPKMGENWIPSELANSKSLIFGVLETHAGVQFLHRWLAMTTALTVILYASFAIQVAKREELVFRFLIIMVVLQLGLGLTTLFTGVAIIPAVLHQAGAVILLSLMLLSLHSLKPLAGQPRG